MHEFLNELNDVQREAVVNTHGPTMVIAGAGSGKTRVLTYRIAYMVKNGVEPFNILALTFTNKAAKEMKERITSILGNNQAKSVWMGTFHSIFARILRQEAELLGYTKSFSIYDTDESRNLIKSIVKELDLDSKTYKANLVHSRISMAKNNLISDIDYANIGEIVQADAAGQKPLIHEIYTKYNQRLRQANAMDFDDLLFNINVLFRDFNETLLKYQSIFKYILVDEYQDTNYAQYLIIKKLAHFNKNICVVGDDAQSIYSFRGANIQNILNFRSDYPEYQLFKLEQNYRSTKNIVEAANSLIKSNKKQIAKEIWTDNDEGTKIKVVKSSTENDEALSVSELLLKNKRDLSLNYSDFAILYRTNAQSRAFEDAFRKFSIPYKIYGGLSFYKRKEIKDLISYFKLVFNPYDEEALKRVINYPQRGIGQTTMEKVTAHAFQIGISVWDVISNPQKYQLPLSATYANRVKDFADKIMSYRAQVETLEAYDLAYLIASTSGVLSDLLQNTEEPERYKNVEELLNAVRDFADSEPEPDFETGEIVESKRTLDEFLGQVVLLTDMDEKEDDNIDKAILMTVHSAKGLEFPVVFVVGCEENLFPSFMSISSKNELEEERRLFYVALTRAEKAAYLSYAETRYKWGQMTFGEPSRFIEDIDEKYLDNLVTRSVAPKFSSRPSFASPQNRTAGSTPYSFSTNTETKKQSVDHSKLVKIHDLSGKSTGETANYDQLATGSIVEHSKFGKGEIMDINGQGDNSKVVVKFNNGDEKTLLLKFARLKLIN